MVEDESRDSGNQKNVLGSLKDWATNYNSPGEGGSLLWILIAIVLYVLDVFVTFFDGFRFSVLMDVFITKDPMNIVRLLFNVVVIIVFIFYWISYRPDKRELISFGFLLILFSLIASFGGFFNIGSLLHIVFAISVLFGLVRPALGDNAQANFLIGVCVFVDFFVFSILSMVNTGWFYMNRLIFPIWVFLTLGLTKRSKIKSLAVIFIMGLYIFNIAAVYPGFYSGAKDTLSKSEIRNGKEFFLESIENFMGFWGKAINDTKKALTEQEKGVLGENIYFTSEVDPNAEQMLGVSIDNFAVSSSGVFQGIPVTLSAIATIGTIDKTINMKVSCKDDGKDVDGVIIKPKEFAVKKFDEKDITCIFEPGSLGIGTSELSMVVGFDFETRGTQLITFMDENILREYERKNLDPLTANGLSNRDIESFHSPGPVDVALKITTGQPISIGSDSGKEFVVDLVISKIGEGKLKEMKEIYIITSDNIDVSQLYEEYSCSGSHGNYALEESGCEVLGDEEKRKGCNDNLHIVYKVDLESYPIKDVDKEPLSMQCHFYIGKNSLNFGAGEIVRKYIKVVSRYDYEIENKIGVEIKDKIGVKSVLLDCLQKCEDQDGCSCPDNDCIMKEVKKGESCGKEGESVENGKTEASCDGNWWDKCGDIVEGQTGIFCNGKKWVPTTPANEDDDSFHSKEECDEREDIET